MSIDKLWHSAALFCYGLVRSARFVCRDEFFSGRNSRRRSFHNQQQELNDQRENAKFLNGSSNTLYFEATDFRSTLFLILFNFLLMFVYAFCPSTCPLSLSIPSQLSTGASCVCFFCPSVTPNTKYKSVKIQRQTSCGFHLWNPTKLQEKVLATGLRIPQPVSFLEKTGLNCFELPFKDAPTGESQDSECERGCCWRWVWSGRSSCDSFTTTGLTFFAAATCFCVSPALAAMLAAFSFERCSSSFTAAWRHGSSQVWCPEWNPAKLMREEKCI